MAPKQQADEYKLAKGQILKCNIKRPIGDE